MSAGRVGRDLHDLMWMVERYLRLEAVDKLTVVSTCVVVAAITFALATSAIFFLSTGLVKTLTLVTDNEMLSYYIVGAGLVLIILLVFLLRKPLIENVLVKSLSKSILEAPSVTDAVMEKKKEADLRKLAKSIVSEMGDYDEEGGDL